MSSNKKTITIPASLGSNNLSETFGKITFTTEVKELLSALNAEISVRYNPDNDKPTVSVVSDTGKTMCSLAEFKALSGYRRFVGEMLKEVEKEESTNKKIDLIAYFLRLAKQTASLNVPARIVEQNYTKFNQFGANIQVVLDNVETIDQTVDNVWKDYLLDTAMRLLRVLYTGQLKCMSSEVLAKDWIDGNLLSMGVPKWLYLKFSDKNFTTNLKHDSVVLLFPKNNYLKSLAMTKKELEDEPFLTKNRVVLETSGGIIALSRKDFSKLFPPIPEGIEEQVDAFIEGFYWTLTNPYTEEEILEVREGGKMPPIFRESVARGSGRANRPESELAKITRQIGNTLGLIQATWNGILNFVIPVANPKTEFWVHLFANAENWQITPTNSIYDCIRAEGNMAPLRALRSATSADLLERIGAIIAQVCQVPHGSADFTDIIGKINRVLNRQGFVERNQFIEPNGFEIRGLEGMETTPVTDAEQNAARVFLGIKTRGSKKKKRTNASAVRLHTSVLNELRPIKDRDVLYEPVIDWLGSTFKTHERHKLQLIAAERILGEVIKHQDKIFDEIIEDDELLEIEGYYDDDE